MKFWLLITFLMMATVSWCQEAEPLPNYLEELKKIRRMNRYECIHIDLLYWEIN